MSSHRFDRDARLTTQGDFRMVFARPRVSQDRCFRILYRETSRQNARLGMAVSTKVCKQAVGRNRLKRIVRESFRHHQATLAEQGGRDIVVLPSRQAATICNAELRDSLASHWHRIGRGETTRPPARQAKRRARPNNRNND